MSFSHFFGHLRTVLRHRHAVFRNCVKAGIPLRGLLHDLSKFSPAEFLPGVRYYDGHRSPNEGERLDRGYSVAWMHHKGRNRHHFEYWTDYNPATRRMEPVKMPAKYVAEMFCDRVAASRVYRGKEYTDADPLAYFMRGKDTRVIHPDTSAALESFLVMLAEKGEKETFRALRRWLKNEGRRERKA